MQIKQILYIIYSVPMVIFALDYTGFPQENCNQEEVHAWIYFKDKGFQSQAEIVETINRFIHNLDPKTKYRRAKVRGEVLADFRDLEVYSSYIEVVLQIGVVLRTTSRWLNAVSISGPCEVLRTISKFEFVSAIRPVLAGKRRGDSSYSVPQPGYENPEQPNSRLEYGPSYFQLDEINVLPAHEAGFNGQGVYVLMLDTGYIKDHEAIPNSQIVAEWDFINNDGNTQNEEGDPENQHNHGTYTLSTLGGRLEGVLYGPAFEAEFLLAKTEDTSQEEPIEEDWYVSGLEWGEEMGADIVSSSLGYIDWYEFEDLDGQTAVTTIAVNIAIENGMIIVTAAGNSGEDGIVAPADAFDVISCGAVDSTGTLAWFSSMGPSADGRIKPEVCARGLNTWCAIPPNDSTAYGYVSGTSLSTPLVAGACAVILSAHPDWTPRHVRQSLLLTASQFENPNNEFGWGIINVWDAINLALTSGDVNMDDLIDILDVILVIQFILGNDFPTEVQNNAADINNDGTINILDVVAIVNLILYE